MNTNGMNTLFFSVNFYRKGQCVNLAEGKVTRSDRARFQITPGQTTPHDPRSMTVGEYVQRLVDLKTGICNPSFVEELDSQEGPMFVLDTSKYFTGEDGKSYITCFVSEVPEVVLPLTIHEKEYKLRELLCSAIGALEEHRDESTLLYVKSEFEKL